jgi:hypothetical protein
MTEVTYDLKNRIKKLENEKKSTNEKLNYLCDRIENLQKNIESLDRNYCTLPDWYRNHDERLEKLENIYTAKLLHKFQEEKIKESLNSMAPLMPTFQERIEKLEALIKPFESPEIIKRMEKLESTNRIWFEDPEVIKRIQLLERDMRSIKDFGALDSIFERITKLENYMEMEDRITVSDVLNRIQVIEYETDKLGKKVKNLENPSSENPHKKAEICNICLGFGGRGIHKPCPHCQSSGIIWK